MAVGKPAFFSAAASARIRGVKRPSISPTVVFWISAGRAVGRPLASRSREAQHDAVGAKSVNQALRPTQIVEHEHEAGCCLVRSQRGQHGLDLIIAHEHQDMVVGRSRIQGLDHADGGAQTVPSVLLDHQTIVTKLRGAAATGKDRHLVPRSQQLDGI
jgi:hypothetical protein